MTSHARPLFRLVRPSRRWWLGVILALIAQSAVAQFDMEPVLKNMLSAVQKGSLEEFTAAGDAAFKSKMTKEMMSGVTAQLGPRLRQGYTSTFLGTLREQGYIVYLWKLEFKDGNDDRLVTMAVKDGKVGGFFLR